MEGCVQTTQNFVMFCGNANFLYEPSYRIILVKMITRNASMIFKAQIMFSSDKFKIKVIANDPETIEDSKIEICKDLFIVNIVYNDVLVGFWNRLNPSFCIISSELEFSIPSISCLFVHLGSFWASAIHSKNSQWRRKSILKITWRKQIKFKKK